MPLLQLNPLIPLTTPLGKGDAVLVEDDGIELWWTIILCDTQAIVQFKNNQVRAARAYGRGIATEEMKGIVGLPQTT